MGWKEIVNKDDDLMLNQIWDIQGNLILRKDGTVSAIYEVPSKIVSSVDGAGKEEIKDFNFLALDGLHNYHDFNIRTVPIDQDLSQRFNQLMEDIDWESDTADLAEEVLMGMVEKLYDSIGTLYDYKHYLIVPLKSIHLSKDLKEVAIQSYKTIRNKTLGFLGFEEGVPLNWYDEYEGQLTVLESQLSVLSAKPLSRIENIFINRLQWLRGMSFDRAFEIGQVESDIENLDETNISFENINIIKLNNFDDSSYVAFLPVSELPENVSYLHLSEEIQSLNFPVESIFNVQFSTPKGVFSIGGQAKRARRRMRNSMEETEETGDVQNTTTVRSRFLLEDLQTNIDEGNHLVRYLQTLVITAQSINELKAKFEVLYTALKSIGVGIVRANADQLYLMYKNRMTELLTLYDQDFIQKMSLAAFCENLFFTTRKVGSDVGFYIGRVDNQLDNWHDETEKAIQASSNPVYVNLFQANKRGVEGKETSNPHIGVIGDTGQGKSYLIKLLFLYHSFLKGQFLYIDPKKEMRRQYTKVLHTLERDMPKFDERLSDEELDDFEVDEILQEKRMSLALQKYIKSINFVTLDAKDKSNYGVLDPIVFLEGQEAIDLADSMIDSVLKDNSDVIEAGYLDSINRVLERRERGEKVGMIHVFKDMQESDLEEVQKAGIALEKKAHKSILSLCFSDGSNPSIDLTNKITILEIEGLDLPRDEAVELTKSQKKSLVVLYAVGYFCKRFGQRDWEVETLVVVDEAWQFNSTTVGQAVLKEMKRVGRSQNNFMLFGTQSVRDLTSEDDNTGFGTVFAFLEDKEIEEVLEYMNMEVTKTTKKWIGNMKTTGQCVFFDTFGRRERITVDAMFSEFGELFKTVKSQLKAV